MNRPQHARRGKQAAALAFASALLIIAGLMASSSPAAAVATDVNLGTAASFAVLGSSTVTNTGSSVISGNVGVSPGSAVTGFPPGVVTNGTLHENDAVAIQGQADLGTAYNQAAAEASDESLASAELGGLTFVSGVYTASSSAQLTGTVTLDAKNDPDAVFVFQIGTTLTTASNSSVSLINGADPCHVFWQVGSSATLGTGTSFAGTILAQASVTVNTGASIDGRALARTGAVTLDTNRITAPDCAGDGGGDTTATATEGTETTGATATATEGTETTGATATTTEGTETTGATATTTEGTETTGATATTEGAETGGATTEGTETTGASATTTAGTETTGAAATTEGAETTGTTATTAEGADASSADTGGADTAGTTAGGADTSGAGADASSADTTGAGTSASSADSGGGGGSGTGGSSGQPGSSTAGTSIPKGHPHTGMGGTAPGPKPYASLLLVMGGVTGMGSIAVAAQDRRRRTTRKIL